MTAKESNKTELGLPNTVSVRGRIFQTERMSELERKGRARRESA